MALYLCGETSPTTLALPTVSTISNSSIATFDTDLTENLVEVKCQIIAKQASGTPSPVNPLPITTYTEMNLTRCGVNLLNPALRVNGYYISATGVITPESNSCYIFIKVNVGETYTFSGRAYGTGNKRVHAYDENKNWIEQLDFASMSGTGDYSVTVTIPSGCQYVGLSFAQADSNRQFTASDEVLPYVAYNGTTSNIPFGQTVANGVLDITTGKLTITHWGTEISGNDLNLSPTIQPEGNLWRLSISTMGLPSGTANYMNFMCDIYAPVTSYASCNNTNNSIALNTGAMTQILLHDSTMTTRQEIIDGLNANPLYIVYPLATPIDIQLDSITLQALLNENNIWCDTGDTEVKFLLTVGKKIS